jgi:lipoprotein-anchoring transpeptidase ErfK/SrfK
MSRRILVALLAAMGAAPLAVTAAHAQGELVGLHSGEYSPGTIVIKTNERRLYLILDQGHAMRYPVGVGKSGKQWAGTT